MRAKVAAADPFAAVDAAVEKLEHQLLKLKSRLMTRYHGKANGAKDKARDGTETSDADVEAAARPSTKPVTWSRRSGSR